MTIYFVVFREGSVAYARDSRGVFLVFNPCAWGARSPYLPSRQLSDFVVHKTYSWTWCKSIPFGPYYHCCRSSLSSRIWVERVNSWLYSPPYMEVPPPRRCLTPALILLLSGTTPGRRWQKPPLSLCRISFYSLYCTDSLLIFVENRDIGWQHCIVNALNE